MSLREAILAAAPAVMAQLRDPTRAEVAECLVNFDAMALKGYRDELDELRRTADAVGLVERVLTEEGLI